MSPHDGSFRRQPKQERSEVRLEQLLEAAAQVIATNGISSTTMAMIAKAAEASVGTLYQYFPDKTAVVQALRNRFGEAMEARLADLEVNSAESSVHDIATFLVDVGCEFAEQHPAYFHVFEGTAIGQRDASAKHSLRMLLVKILQGKQPSLTRQRALEIAEVCTHLLKTMPQIYLAAGPKRRTNIATDYVLLLEAYMTQRLNGVIQIS